jgi:hypothetical protein
MKLAKILIGALGAVLLAAGGCTGNDPKLTVTVSVTGIASVEESDRIEKSLKDLVSGPVRYTSSSRMGDTLTIQLSPVIDVQAFSRKINFGRVTESQGNTVKVTLAKQQGT